MIVYVILSCIIALCGGIKFIIYVAWRVEVTVQKALALVI